MTTPAVKKRIIVQRQKHGDVYYDAATKELELEAFKKMFQDGIESQNYFQYDDDVYTEEKEELESDIKKILDLNIDSLPSSLREEMENQKKDLRRKEIQLKELIEEKALFESAKTGDEKALVKFLNSRRDAEYEGFSFETLR